jgi:hypothetical protein
MTFHHNLSSHVQYRTPQISNSDEVEMINNVIYQTTEQATNVNLDANNVVVSGRSRIWANHYSRIATQHREINISTRRGPATNVYVAGNIGPNRSSAALGELECVDPADRVVCQSTSPTLKFANPAVRVLPQTADAALADVLASAGATLPFRDAVDARLVMQARTGTGNLIDRESQVGGYPPLVPVT